MGVAIQSEEKTGDKNVERIQRGAAVKFDSRHLEDYFDRDHVYPFNDFPSPLLAEVNFATRLKSFTTMMESQILYAHCRYQAGANLLQQSAAAYVSLAREAGIPVVSYFCQLSENEPAPNRTLESVELCALLYSMIRQTIDLLPVQFTSSAPVFDEKRLASLDGTLRTWDKALSLFTDLVSCVQLPLLIFFTDGLNVLEDDIENSTSASLERFVRCVNDLVTTSTEKSHNVKFLFTTMGLSRALCHGLDERDMIICNTSTHVGTGTSRRARQVVSY
jgi:hypothetical protein